jgi:short-subunit dehydrogenase involved in D-alanine esterification of teichoic acids
MDTNFFGLSTLICAILPFMRQQGSGTIVNVSSAASIDPRTGIGMYKVSRFALEGKTPLSTTHLFYISRSNSLEQIQLIFAMQGLCAKLWVN